MKQYYSSSGLLFGPIWRILLTFCVFLGVSHYSSIYAEENTVGIGAGHNPTSPGNPGNETIRHKVTVTYLPEEAAYINGNEEFSMEEGETRQIFVSSGKGWKMIKWTINDIPQPLIVNESANYVLDIVMDKSALNIVVYMSYDPIAPDDPENSNLTYFYVNLNADSGGTVDIKSGRYAEGKILTVTATPDEGYHFKGWSDGSTENPRVIKIEEPLTLKATFEANLYSVTYMVDNDIYAIKNVRYGDHSDHLWGFDLWNLPTKEGYTFVGWNNLPSRMPAHDITVEAIFEINTYSVTLYLDGTYYDTLHLEYDVPLELPVPDVPDGYHFQGWGEAIPERMPAHDLKLYGTSSIISSIGMIHLNPATQVTIYDVMGRLIIKNQRWDSIKDELTTNFYIINGEKYLIKR